MQSLAKTLAALSVFFAGALLVQIMKPGSAPEDSGNDILTLTLAQKEHLATFINMNGKLCADVWEVRRRGDSAYYVDCYTHRGKMDRRAYMVDLKAATVE